MALIAYVGLNDQDKPVHSHNLIQASFSKWTHDVYTT